MYAAFSMLPVLKKWDVVPETNEMNVHFVVIMAEQNILNGATKIFSVCTCELMILKENIWHYNLFKVPFLGEFAEQLIKVSINFILSVNAHFSPSGTT